MIDPLFSFMEETFSQMPEEVPLFPLPQMVLLPGEPMPLHIFEEKYKIMTESALAGERLIAMGHMKTEPDKRGSDQPEIYDIAGLGRIVMDEKLGNGRFNLVLLGLRRVRVKEIVQEKPFARARIEVLADRFSQTSSSVIESLSDELLDLFEDVSLEREDHHPAQDLQAAPLDAGSLESLPLGTLCDVLASALNMKPVEKQMLLEETDVIKRAQTLLFTLRYEWESYRSHLQDRPDNIH